MTHHLYRPVATEAIEPEFEWEYGVEPGDNVGRRASGYLSRSSAVDAGMRSGVRFEIQRSNPITFGPQKSTAVDDLAHMGRTLATLVLAGNTDAARAVARVIRDR